MARLRRQPDHGTRRGRWTPRPRHPSCGTHPGTHRVVIGGGMRDMYWMPVNCRRRAHGIVSTTRKRALFVIIRS